MFCLKLWSRVENSHLGKIKKSQQTTAAGSLADWYLSPGHSSRQREIRLLQTKEKGQPSWERTLLLGKPSSQSSGGSPGLKSR